MPRTASSSRQPLAKATAAHSGPALDGALDELGWRDALAVDRRTAVSTLFELQGRMLSTSAALDHVILERWASSTNRRPRSCCPRSGVRSRPARSTATCSGRGPRYRRARGRPSSATPCEGSDEIALVPTDSLGVTSVSGVDPAFGGVTLAADVARRRVVVERRPRRGRPGSRRVASRSRTSSSARRGPCSTWRVSTRSPGCSSIGRSPGSRRCATTGGDLRCHRGRRRRGHRGVGRRLSLRGDGGQGRGGPQREGRRSSLPAGAGRHRLHDRAPAPRLRPARARARPSPG